MVNLESPELLFRFGIHCRRRDDRDRDTSLLGSTKGNLRRETCAEAIIAWEREVCETFQN